MLPGTEFRATEVITETRGRRPSAEGLINGIQPQVLLKRCGVAIIRPWPGNAFLLLTEKCSGKCISLLWLLGLTGEKTKSDVTNLFCPTSVLELNIEFKSCLLHC